MSTLKVDNIRHNSATSDAITTASDGTCTAKLTSIGGGGLSHRNIVINGAMTVAQAGTSASSGSRLLDRYGVYNSGTDEAPTQAQADVASGTTPYTLGYRKSLKITNGNQTSGAGAADRLFTSYQIEAQDIANSGWNYVSSSSSVTLSFWIKSSVAQNFYGHLQTADGTAQNYPFETGSLSADTWTKVTKTIPGNSNITINNDTGSGLSMIIGVYWGTNFTDAGNTMNQWAAYSSTSRMPDNITTWYTTNDATFEFTGVQLEVGDTATSFEHRSFGDELTRCSRYLQIFHVPTSDSKRASNITATVHGAGNGVYLNVAFTHPMRAAPSVTVDGAFGGNVFTGSWSGDTLSSFAAEYETDALTTLGFNGITSASISGSGRTVGLTGQIYTANNGSNDAALIYSAEL